MTDETTDFLFVDESSELQGYKVGYRHDIRSHIRKHSVKRFKEKQKTGQKQQAIAGKQTPLKSQKLGHDTSEPLPQEAELSSLDALLETADIHAGNALELHAQQGDTGSCHNTCSDSCAKRCSRIGQALQPMDTRAWRKHALNQSPVELLGSGRIDPFLSYPVEKPDRALHGLMDFCKSLDLSALIT